MADDDDTCDAIAAISVAILLSCGRRGTWENCFLKKALFGESVRGVLKRRRTSNQKHSGKQ